MAKVINDLPEGPAGDTDVVRQWREATNVNSVLEQEVRDLRVRQQRADLEGKRLSRHRKYLLIALCALAAIAVVLVWPRPGTDRSASTSPPSAAPGTGVPATGAGNDVGRDQVLAQLRAIPPVQPLPCAAGKWIAQLGTTLSNDVGRADLQDRLSALRSRSTGPLDLKVAPTLPSCETFARKDYLVVYAGPFPSSAEALDVCRSFGWNSASEYDLDQCFVVALDPAPALRYVYPDGSAHESMPG